MAKTPQPDTSASARDAKLRKKIEEVAKGEASAADEKQPLSPREFIHKRMAELDKKKGT